MSHHTVHIHRKKSNSLKTLFVTLTILVALAFVAKGIFVLTQLAKPLTKSAEPVRQISSTTLEIVPWEATATPRPTPTMIPGKDYVFTSENIGITFNYNSHHGRYEEHFASSWKGGSAIEGEDMWSVRFFHGFPSNPSTHTIYAATPNYAPEDWEGPKLWLSTPLNEVMSAETVEQILRTNSLNPLLVKKVTSRTGIVAFEMWSYWCTGDCTIYRDYIIPYNNEGYSTIIMYSNILRVPEAHGGLSADERSEILTAIVEDLSNNIGSVEAYDAMFYQDSLFNTLKFR